MRARPIGTLYPTISLPHTALLKWSCSHSVATPFFAGLLRVCLSEAVENSVKYSRSVYINVVKIRFHLILSKDIFRWYQKTSFGGSKKLLSAVSKDIAIYLVLLSTAESSKCKAMSYTSSNPSVNTTLYNTKNGHDSRGRFLY